jgi:hypothetical protein
MGKRVYMVAASALLVAALASFEVSAQDMWGKGQSLSCSRPALLAAIVKNSRGHVIGIVKSVENVGGQTFVIINHGPDSYYGEGGGYTPVPIGVLKVAMSSQAQSNHLMTLVLNKTEKQMEAAPFWDPTRMNDRKYEAKIDKFFGAQPSFCG